MKRFIKKATNGMLVFVLLVAWLTVAVFLVELLYYLSINWAGGFIWVS